MIIGIFKYILLDYHEIYAQKNFLKIFLDPYKTKLINQ
jgi:hypothetical protein